MTKFLIFTAPNGVDQVYVDPKQVVRVMPRLSGQPGTAMDLANGHTQEVREPLEDVVRDLEGAD